MRKQIWELTNLDISENAVWYFPMSEDDDCDDAMVCPATQSDTLDPNTQLIVKANFIDSQGTEFIGYIYYGLTEIEYSQPCMFKCNDAINFWFGVSKPERDDLIGLHFPIVATSISTLGLASKSVVINGLSYITDNAEAQVIHCSHK